jgi:DNA polymerase I-like protein with 3'-5' exonuclease and polymerase domains
LLEDSDSIVVIQNARFDIRSLCEMGIVDWNEPCDPSFWDHILDLKHLAHLHDSSDAEFGASLKVLAPKYLGIDYASQKNLEELTKRVRSFVKKEFNWNIADADNPMTPGKEKLHFSDYWVTGSLVLAALRSPSIMSKVQLHFREDELDMMFNPGVPIVDQYLRDDCNYTLALAESFLLILSDRHGDELDNLLSMNQQLLPVLWKMEVTGVPVHKSELTEAIATCESWIAYLRDNCYSLSREILPETGRFTDSQLREVLFTNPKGFKLEPIKSTPSGDAASVDASVITGLKRKNIPADAQAFLANVLAWKKYCKKHEYLLSYEKATSAKFRAKKFVTITTDRNTSPLQLMLYPSFDESGTGTTRLTSRSPNAQNITKAMNPFEKDFPDVAALLELSPSVRGVFGPPPGYVWYAMDYSQLQLRIFAVASGEQALIQAFEDGWDAHDYMAHRIFRLPEGVKPDDAQRRQAKAVNFGFIFGAGESKIDATAGRSGLYQEVLQMFPNSRKFIELTKQSIKKFGYVKTLGGYPLAIPWKPSRWRPGDVQQAAHAGVNYIVQGTEGEIVKRGMSQCHAYMSGVQVDELHPLPVDFDGRIVMQVHDENVFQLPKDTSLDVVNNLRLLMERAGSYYGVRTPVDADLITRNWNKKQKLHF